MQPKPYLKIMIRYLVILSKNWIISLIRKIMMLNWRMSLWDLGVFVLIIML